MTDDFKDEIRDRMGRCTGGLSHDELVDLGMEVGEAVAREINLPRGLDLHGYGITGSLVRGDFGRRTNPRRVAAEVISDPAVPPGVISSLESGESVEEVRAKVQFDPSTGQAADDALSRASCSDLDIFISYTVTDIGMVEEDLGISTDQLRSTDPGAFDYVLRDQPELVEIAEDIATPIPGGVDLKIRWAQVVDEQPSRHILEEV